jgi:enediyne biosynthesis protein E4
MLRRLAWTGLLGSLLLGVSPASPPVISKIDFVDVAAQAGLTARHITGVDEGREYIIESTGSGLALIDYNNDGFLDIFFVNGTTLEGFPKGEEPVNHLYRNNKDGTFTDVTAEASLIRSGWGQGTCVGDFDNDGWEDLFVTYYGQNVLYRNTGGRFEDVTGKAGLLQKTLRWNSGCCFLDYDRDGKLDLFVANYVDFDLSKTMAKKTENCLWRGIPVFCGPRGLKPAANILYRNNGDGTFADVSQKTGIGDPVRGFGLTALAADFDNNGWPDIYIACDSSPSLYYQNQGNGTFQENGLFNGTALDRDGKEQGAMGTETADYDGDGLLDIVKTNFDGDLPNLFHNNGDGTFTDVSSAAGVGLYNYYLSWATGFLDADNDGWKDLFIINAHVYPEVEKSQLKRTYRQRPLFFYNLGTGSFRDISNQAGPGFQTPRSSHGAAAGDLDNDGSLEIVISNVNDTPTLLKNKGDHQNWLTVKAVGAPSNRAGIGARLVLYTGQRRQTDEVRSGGSYISQNDLRRHFGLGTATKADRLEVAWPSGRRECFRDIKANQVVVIKEGSGEKLEATPK